MGSYLAHGLEIYPKAHENPRAFPWISSPIYLKSSTQRPCGIGLHQVCYSTKQPWSSCFYCFLVVFFLLILHKSIAKGYLDLSIVLPIQLVHLPKNPSTPTFMCMGAFKTKNPWLQVNIVVGQFGYIIYWYAWILCDKVS